MKLLWTTRELAEAAGVSRSTIWRIIRRHPHKFRPPSLRRRGNHPRKHRIFAEEEARFILQVLAGPPSTQANPQNRVKGNLT